MKLLIDAEDSSHWKRFSPMVRYIPGKRLVVAAGLSHSPLPHKKEHEEQAHEKELFVNAVI